METVDISELRTRFSYFVRRVEAGDEFLVMRRGEPVVMLIRADDAGTEPVSKG